MNVFTQAGQQDLRVAAAKGTRPRYCKEITSDLREVHGAIVVAGIQPSRTDVCRFHAKTDRELSGSWWAPDVTPETPVTPWGSWNIL